MHQQRHSILSEHVTRASFSKPIDLAVSYVERRTDSQDMRVFRLPQVGDSILRRYKCPSAVDTLNQVVSLDCHLLNTSL